MSDSKDNVPRFSAYHDEYNIIPFENVDAVEGDILNIGELTQTFFIDVYLKSTTRPIRLEAECGARAFMDEYKAYLRRKEATYTCDDYGGPRE